MFPRVKLHTPDPARDARTVVVTALGVAVLVGGVVGAAIGWVAGRLGLKHP